jgi:WD40 repeat protein
MSAAREEEWAKPEGDEQQSRTDSFGDPLPPGAVARVGTLRLSHGHVMSLVYAPDGRTIAACGGGYIQLWNTATGKEVQRFQGPEKGALSLAISPDGGLLAAAGWGDVMVWRLAPNAGREARRLPGTEGGADAVAFSPDGKLLAAACKDQLIRVWEVGSWRVVRQLPRPKAFCLCLAFFPDGKTLVEGGYDNTIRQWDVDQGRPLRRLEKKLDGISAVALSPDGKRLATVQEHRRLRIWDTATGEQVRQFIGPDHSCYCATFSPDGKTLATGSSADGVVRIWDPATGQERYQWSCPQSPQRLAFSPDGKTLAVAAGRIRFRDVATGKEVWKLAALPDDGVRSLTFSEDGRTLVTSCWGAPIGFWDPVTGKERAPLRGPPRGFSPPPHTVIPPALSRGGRRVAAVDREEAVWVWEAATGQRLTRFGGSPGTYTYIVFTPDDRSVATAYPDKTIRLWDAATGEPLRQIGRHHERVNLFAFSPDGKVLAVTYADRAVRLWDSVTGKELGRLHCPDGMALSLTFSPDGKILAAGLAALRENGEFAVEGTLLRLWEVATGKLIKQVHGDWHSTCSVAFSPDGKTLAAGTRLDTVHLWEVASGLERGRFTGHQSSVETLAFAPDGQLLASGSGDGTALIWDVTGRHGRTRPPRMALSASALRALWADLARVDGPRAHRAIGELTAAGDQAVGLLKEQLRPVAPEDPKRIARLIAELDGERFGMREEAQRTLEELGELAATALRKALEGGPSLEVRRRVETLLQKLEGPVTAPRLLRHVRSVEVLEHIATLRARQVLEALAQGAPEARLTREAKAALQRLARRPNRKP